jgi:hypothetical protein
MFAVHLFGCRRVSEFVYKVPGAGAKLREVCDTAWPGNGAVWTDPRLAAVYEAASLATGTTAGAA